MKRSIIKISYAEECKSEVPSTQKNRCMAANPKIIRMKRILILFLFCAALSAESIGQSASKKANASSSRQYEKLLLNYNDSIRQLQIMAPRIGYKNYRAKMDSLMNRKQTALVAMQKKRDSARRAVYTTGH